jgi:hypothetical protein
VRVAARGGRCDASLESDLATLQLVSGSFVDPELESSQSDLLFSVQIQDRPALLYFSFEHQSTVEELMAFRILKKFGRLSPAALERIGAGSEQSLLLWTTRALSADSVAAVLED